MAPRGFRGSDLHRRRCGTESAVDGCCTIHWRKAGIGARLSGAPTRGTSCWDRPGALWRHWGRPGVQPRVRGGRFCRFWRKKVDFGRTSRPTGFRVEPISAKSMSRGSNHTLTGRRCVGSSLFETRPGALYSPRRLLHVDGDFSAFVGGRITSSNTWCRLGRFLACGSWREILHWSGPAVVALERRLCRLGRWAEC